MIHLSLAARDAAGALFAGPVPAVLQPGWFLATLRLPGQPGRWLAHLWFGDREGEGEGRGIVLARPFARHMFGAKAASFFLMDPPRACTIRLVGVALPPDSVRLHLVPLHRASAMAGVWLQNPSGFAAAFRSTTGSPAARIRRTLVLSATHGQDVPADYATWCDLYDTWTHRRLQALEARLCRRPAIAALVFAAQDGTDGPALAATLASLADQVVAPATTIVHKPGAPAPAPTTAWIALLQAGETIPPHALLLLAAALQAPDPPDILYADEDSLTQAGARVRPVFKPQPSLTFMCSGLLSRGLWLVRASLFQPSAQSAEAARLLAWFALHEAGHGTARRLPYILTHTREDVRYTKPAELASIVDAALARAQVAATVRPDFPLRLQWHPADAPGGRVTIVIPSRLKGETQLGCIGSILRNTEYGQLRILIVVTQATGLDAEQEAARHELEADPRVAVRLLHRARFNYSAANNFAAGQTEGEFLCLLNDDVSPLEPGWLARMVAMLSDPGAAIVGAKLYYPDMTTQHGGVIMGFGGLAQHAHRFLTRGEPGYCWRAVLDQELSCVTGACLLVRRPVFDAVGGLDESLPAAFNDVDFCLKVRQAGHGVVFAASVELVHHETITFGHHYSANRDQEFVDGARMIARWKDVLADDPFYNPNLRLLDTQEWQLAFPPRTDPDRLLARPEPASAEQPAVHMPHAQ